MQYKFDIDISVEKEFWGKDFEEMLMPIEEWKKYVQLGYFIDYDGYGSLVNKNKVCKTSFYPSDIDELPKEATHIIWYNR